MNLFELQMPKVEFRSNAKPSLFGYIPPLEEKKKDDREKVATAVLSIAARAKKRGAAPNPSVATAAVTASASSITASTSEKMDVVSVFIVCLIFNFVFMFQLRANRIKRLLKILVNYLLWGEGKKKKIYRNELNYPSS